MVLFDTHVHTKFSPDGTSGLEEYAAAADSKALKGIGFAEHVDFLPEGSACGFLDYKRYINNIESFRKKGYSFFAGAEIDYAQSVESEISEFIKLNPFDYLIASVHIVNGFTVSDGFDFRFRENDKTFEGIVEQYYKEVNSSLKFDACHIIGHIGIYKRYFTKESLDSLRFKKMIDELEHDLARNAVNSDKIIEVNTSGLFAHVASTIPGIGFLKEYYKNGGRKISLGSDAHNAVNVTRGFDRAAEMLKEIGFSTILLPWDVEKSVSI